MLVEKLIKLFILKIFTPKASSSVAKPEGEQWGVCTPKPKLFALDSEGVFAFYLQNSNSNL